MDVSDDAQLSLDVSIFLMLKDALDWAFAGLTLAEQNGVWKLCLG